MTAPRVVPLLALFACTPEVPSQPAKQAVAEAPAAEPTEAKAQAAAPAEEAKPDATVPPTEPPKPTLPPRLLVEPTDDADAVDWEGLGYPPAPPIEVKPWASTAHEAPWRLVAEPAEPLALAVIGAGVIGKSGSTWQERGPDGQLALVEMDREPKLPMEGTWPSDAWFIDSRINKGESEEMDYHEIRLMKLRGGKRWVPQRYGYEEQWFHPGTEQWLEPRVSPKSGMLVFDPSDDQLTRVAGKHPDPPIGAHRGRTIDYVESMAGGVYVFSVDAKGTYAQTACEHEECVGERAVALPAGEWTFGLQVARAKFSVSVVATKRESQHHLLHRDGKAEKWLLEDLATVGKPDALWATADGGMWMRTGEVVRHRDPAGAWRDVAVPKGLTGISLAVTEDRKELWLSGTIDGAAKVFATHANAQASPPAP